MFESMIERKFVRYCREQGIVTLKLNPVWYRNIPDRIVIFPGDLCFFLELKRLGEKPRPGQVKRIRRLRKMGYTVHVADSLEKAKQLVEENNL